MPGSCPEYRLRVRELESSAGGVARPYIIEVPKNASTNSPGTRSRSAEGEPVAGSSGTASNGSNGSSPPNLESGIPAAATAIVDAYGKVKAVSGTFASALKIRREELFGQPLPTVVRTEDRPALAHAIAAVASGDWPGCSLEVRFLQHGRDDRVVLLHLEADAPQRVRINATDLTSERETRRILQEYESSLRALTAHALDIWGLVNDNGTIRSMSESVSVHLGWTAAELDNAPLLELVHPQDRDVARELYRSLKADPQAVRSGVYRVRHKDGGYRTLESTMSGFNPEVFSNSVFVINARDVTARERTEAALREVEYRFSQLVEQALTGIVVVQQGRVVYANPRFQQLIGLSPDAIAARPRIMAMVERQSVPALRDARDEIAMGGNGAIRAALRIKHVMGRAIEVDVAASMVDFEGHPALLCTVTDMTEARALQVRMAEAEKVEAVGLLAGGVAHDFNNMLTGILAWVDIASDEVGSASPIATALEEIRTSAERAAELTRQLLAFGRRQLLEPRPLDLGEVVVRLKRWMDRVLGPDHPLSVSVPDAPWLIEADRMQIERAITALIMNSQDAMPTGGEIKVGVRHEVLTSDEAEHLGPLSAGEHVVVTVTDTGVGMDEATRRRVFEPFFTTKPHGRGTGLGLAAVLGTVLQSGGAIVVDSVEGVGTEFRCYFPRLLAPSEHPTGPRRAPTSALRPPRNVLVVEDDPQLGKVLRRLLQERGHSVRLAASPGEAEQMAEAEAADVIVCDVGLPGMRGSTLAGSLRMRGLVKNAVLISGRPITQDEQIEAGSRTVVLSKPFRPHRLLDAVDEATRSLPVMRV